MGGGWVTTGAAIESVVFDIGGVLIDWNPEHLYRKMFDDHAQMAWFLGNVCTSEWNAHQDRGRPFALALADAIARHPTWKPYIDAYWTRWLEMVSGPLDATVAVLDALRRQPVRLLGLSNWSAETFPWMRAHYAFLAWFEAIVVSGEEGITKPEPEIFLRMIERHHLEPERTLFIDDNPRNIAAARSLGLQASLFTTADALHAELVARALLRPEDAP